MWIGAGYVGKDVFLLGCFFPYSYLAHDILQSLCKPQQRKSVPSQSELIVYEQPRYSYYQQKCLSSAWPWI